jgi:hypothetical protein
MYIDPPLVDTRLPVKNHNLIGDDRVRAACLSVLDTYNRGAYLAVPAMVGRALEGVVKDRLKNEKDIDLTKTRMLGPLLGKLADVDLAKPLKDLANALTEARNIGTHFDLDIEPTEDMSTKMLTLLEVIIEYIYVLPAQVLEFKQYVTREGTSSET